MQSIKEFFMGKFTMQTTMLLSNFAASHVIEFATRSQVQSFLGHVFKDPTLLPGADDFLHTSITAAIMFAGQIVAYHFHEKVILPKVNAQQSQISEVK